MAVVALRKPAAASTRAYSGPYADQVNQAAAQAGVDPLLLGSVLYVETGGFDPAVINGSKVSPAGAVGIAQIHLPSHPDVTRADAANPAFAIPWAARYLASLRQKNGSTTAALRAYNTGSGLPSVAGDQYVNLVENAYRKLKSAVRSFVFPLPAGVAFQRGGSSGFGGPVDQGVDIETGAAGVGKPVLAIGSGSYVGSRADPGGFGPTQVVYKLDNPPAGAPSPYVYVGHAAALPGLEPGAPISAGQPVATIRGGGEYGGQPGHIELGYGDPSAQGFVPLARARGEVGANYHETGTPAGSAFQQLLANLSGARVQPAGFFGDVGGAVSAEAGAIGHDRFYPGGPQGAIGQAADAVGKLTDPKTWVHAGSWLALLLFGLALMFVGLTHAFGRPSLPRAVPVPV